MDQKEFIEKVEREARRRVDKRLSIFQSDLNEAFRKLIGPRSWFSFCEGDIRKQIMNAYLSTEGSDKWPKILYEIEAEAIIDTLLKPVNI
jgi:hypothetical protein